MTGTGRVSLVTGGGGFLGGAVVRALLARGDRVLSVARGDYPALTGLGVTTLRADLADDPAPWIEAVRAAGVDTVFHCAARPGVFGRASLYERANLTATQNVLAACRAAAVPRLVFTSSPSVVFAGSSHRDAGRDLPYPKRYLAHYPRTKALAERLVLAADGGAHDPGNGPVLRTVALRPHLIFGPGDPNLVPRLLERADGGRLRIVGSGDSVVSLTYVENAAHAHLAAAEALEAAANGGVAAPCAGRAFFVNQREPVRLWDWINAVLTGTGRAPVTRRVPAGLAYAAGAACELAWRALGRTGEGASEPPMTRFVAKQLATSHSYSMAPFEEAVGGRYRERVDLAEATARTIEWASQLAPAPGREDS